MALIEINNRNYQQAILADKDFKLVVFGAKWCGPCQMFAPVVREIGAEVPEVKICLNDIDVSTAASEQFGIMSVPTVIVMKNGEEQERLTGGQTKETLLNIIEKYK